MRTGLEALKELKECIITLLQDYGTYGSNREKIYNKYCNEERKLIEVIEKDLLFVEILKKTFKFGVEEQKIGDTKLNWKIIAEKLTNEYDKQIRDFILKECFPKELKTLEILALLLGLNTRNRTALRDALESGWITQEQYDLVEDELKRYKENKDE